jgi:hypothetical protein
LGILYLALIENRSFLTSKNSGSQFNRSIEGDTVYWYWVGKHDEDDRLIG